MARTTTAATATPDKKRTVKDENDLSRMLRRTAKQELGLIASERRIERRLAKAQSRLAKATARLAAATAQHDERVAAMAKLAADLADAQAARAGVPAATSVAKRAKKPKMAAAAAPPPPLAAAMDAEPKETAGVAASNGAAPDAVAAFPEVRRVAKRRQPTETQGGDE